MNVVIELLLLPDGTARIENVLAPQAPWLVGTNLEDPLEELRSAFVGAKALPSRAILERARAQVAEQLLRIFMVAIGLSPDAVGHQPAFDIRFRVRSLRAEVAAGASTPWAWLRFTPYDDTIKRSGKTLKAADLGVQFVGARRASRRWTLRLSSQRFALTRSVVLESDDGRSWPLVSDVLLEPGQARVFEIALTARQQLDLSAARTFKVRADFEGRSSPIRTKPLRLSDAALKEVDLLLDVGSTVTKHMFVPIAGEAAESPADINTAKWLREHGIPRYDKREFARDPGLLLGWLAEGSSALRDWAISQGVVLRHVHIALPEVNRAGKAWTQAERRFRSKTAKQPWSDHLTGSVALHREHELLSGLFRAALSELLGLVEEQASKIDRTKAAIARAKSSKAAWERKRADHNRTRSKLKQQRDKAWFFANTRFPDPGSYRAPRPKDAPKPERGLESWMKALRADPSRLGRLLLLDAGGMSLDVAVVEPQKGAAAQVIKTLSRSFACGGEEVSLRIGRKVAGNAGTAYKQMLGLRRSKASARKKLDEYESATRAVYEKTLRDQVFGKLGTRWRGRACVVALTGGGGANPFLRELIEELVKELVKEKKLDAQCFQADDLAGYIQRLESQYQLASGPALRRFIQVHSWSRGRGMGTSEGGHYDKFAMLGGMWIERADQGGA